MNTISIIQEVVNANYTNFSKTSPVFEENFVDDAVKARWADTFSVYLHTSRFHHIEIVGKKFSLTDEKSIFMKSGTKALEKQMQF
jgi:hypothetical protein